jgi:hypothetical protein
MPASPENQGDDAAPIAQIVPTAERAAVPVEQPVELADAEDSPPPAQTAFFSGTDSPTKGPDEKFCHECGAVIRARAEICPACGIRQHNIPDSDRALEPDNGVAILTLGVLCFFFCVASIILGPITWAWANKDLRAMSDGMMNPAGRGTTTAGKICAMMATILWMTVFGCYGLLILNSALGILLTANK